MNDQPQSPLAKKILDRIEGEGLLPRPRWEFLARDWFFWSVGGVSVALGALAIAAALFEVANADWPFYAERHQDFVTFFIHAAPFLWIIVLALFILLGFANIRHTRRGYRYPFWLIALGAVLTSAVLGGALFASGVGERVEEAVGDHPPFYRPIEAAERAWWDVPAHGLLGGTVVGVSSSSDAFYLQSFDGSVWLVDASALGATSTAAALRGGTVRVVGVASGSSTFESCDVYGWQVSGAKRAEPAPRPFAFAAPPNQGGESANAPMNPAPAETFAVATRTNPCTDVPPYGPNTSAGE